MTAREGDGIEAVLREHVMVSGFDEIGDYHAYACACSATGDSDDWHRAHVAAALRASAPDDGLRTAVEALADEWEGYRLAGIAEHYHDAARELRALLADQPPTQPEGDDHA